MNGPVVAWATASATVAVLESQLHGHKPNRQLAHDEIPLTDAQRARRSWSNMAPKKTKLFQSNPETVGRKGSFDMGLVRVASGGIWTVVVAGATAAARVGAVYIRCGECTEIAARVVCCMWNDGVGRGGQGRAGQGGAGRNEWFGGSGWLDGRDAGNQLRL